MKTWQVNSAGENQRLDRYLSQELSQISRTQLKDWIKAGHVLVNGQVEKASYRLQVGDVIQVHPPQTEDKVAPPQAQALAVDIVYEDEDLLVVNKGKDMVVHPGGKHKDGTLVNALLAHVEENGESLAASPEVYRPGIIHRIDKDTTGLLVVAKSDLAFEQLSQQALNHSMERIYTALVYGQIVEDQASIKIPIRRHPKDRLRYEGHEEGRPAVTHFKVYTRFQDYTHVGLRLETGRTHQIRVHMQYIGHPLVDDPLYAREHKDQFFTKQGQFLHAGTLSFTHPRTMERLTFTVPLPEPYQEILANLPKKPL